VLRDAASKIEYFPTIGYNMRKTVCQESIVCCLLNDALHALVNYVLMHYVLNRLVY